MKLISSLESNEGFLKWIDVNHNEENPPIAIICGYQGQKNSLKRNIEHSNKIKKLKDKIRIDTVDSYQGKENLIVIYSIVRNNYKGPASTIKQGFLLEPNRLNVALSRAKDRLIIVGSKERWADSTTLSKVSNVVDQLVEKGSAKVVPADD